MKELFKYPLEKQKLNPDRGERTALFKQRSARLRLHLLPYLVAFPSTFEEARIRVICTSF